MNDIKIGSMIVVGGEPYVVQLAQHVQMGRGGAILRTKIKNLVSGSVLEKTFKGGDRIEDAELVRSRANFLYREETTFHFMDTKTFEQFSLDRDEVGNISYFIKEGSEVDVLNFQEKPVAIELPSKVALKVRETQTGVRGNTAQGSIMKPATLETEYVVDVPLFVKEGDIVRINTQTGQYIERLV